MLRSRPRGLLAMTRRAVALSLTAALAPPCVQGLKPASRPARSPGRPRRLGSRRVLEDLINVADFERVAAEKLDPGVAGYFFGGANDEVTLAENVAAWRRWRLRPRVLAGHGEWSTGVDLLGGELATPILVAPVAYQRLVDDEGEPAMARAAAAAGTVMCLSTL